MNIKLFTIPNFLTLGNLFCGCLAVLVLTTEIGVKCSYVPVVLLVLLMLSLLFDLLDGMVARAMKINSEIGVQLDSLADMVTFGFFPGILMFKLINMVAVKETAIPFAWVAGLLIVLFSALRLAKFNVDTEQSTYFKGLATPANTILIFSFYWIFQYNHVIINPNFDQIFLVIISIVLSILLIANIPLFSFKFKGFAWNDNHYKYVFLIISIILLILFQMNSVPFIILLYIIISIIFRKKIIHA